MNGRANFWKWRGVIWSWRDIAFFKLLFALLNYIVTFLFIYTHIIYNSAYSHTCSPTPTNFTLTCLYDSICFSKIAPPIVDKKWQGLFLKTESCEKIMTKCSVIFKLQFASLTYIVIFLFIYTHIINNYAYTHTYSPTVTNLILI